MEPGKGRLRDKRVRIFSIERKGRPACCIRHSTTKSLAAAPLGDVVFDSTKPWNLGVGSHGFARRFVKVTVFFVAFIVLTAILYRNVSPSGFFSFSYYFSMANHLDPKLRSVLRSAAMADSTVILTTLNDAWAEPGSIFDLFLKSFRIGNNTLHLLKHLVVITLDEKAHDRCMSLHPHCYYLESRDENFSKEAFFMTSSYLHMMWRRIEFLGSILKMGYSFVFTDSDIMWLRNPFPHFFEDADFQIACDYFTSDSYSTDNNPNAGLTYVRSNMKTIRFYKFWYASRLAYPDMHDQDVFNKIKTHPFLSVINLELRFLDTTYYGGFCEPSKDFDKVCTMHANCCVGLENKVYDVKLLLEDWKKYKSFSSKNKAKPNPQWSIPQSCRTSFQRGNTQKNTAKGDAWRVDH